MDWKTMKEGQKLIYSYDEFDGKGTEICTVTQVLVNHAIASYDNVILWIDEDTEHMFSLLSRHGR